MVLSRLLSEPWGKHHMRIFGIAARSSWVRKAHRCLSGRLSGEQRTLCGHRVSVAIDPSATSGQHHLTLQQRRWFQALCSRASS
jgi:hypothetical protein